jgi:hypothetical protein
LARFPNTRRTYEEINQRDEVGGKKSSHHALAWIAVTLDPKPNYL